MDADERTKFYFTLILMALFAVLVYVLYKLLKKKRAERKERERMKHVYDLQARLPNNSLYREVCADLSTYLTEAVSQLAAASAERHTETCLEYLNVHCFEHGCVIATSLENSRVQSEHTDDTEYSLSYTSRCKLEKRYNFDDDKYRLRNLDQDECKMFVETVVKQVLSKMIAENSAFLQQNRIQLSTTPQTERDVIENCDITLSKPNPNYSVARREW